MLYIRYMTYNYLTEYNFILYNKLSRCLYYYLQSRDLGTYFIPSKTKGRLQAHDAKGIKWSVGKMSPVIN